MNFLILLSHGGGSSSGGLNPRGVSVTDVFSVISMTWNFLRTKNIVFGSIRFSLFDIVIWGLLLSSLFYLAYRVSQNSN